MPVKNSHIIQKQTFELSASGTGINLNWEQRASDCVRNIINPCIEECFNEASSAGHHLIIDKLDIDLGHFGSAEFEKTVAQKLKAMLSVQLQSCITSSQNNNKEEGAPAGEIETDIDNRTYNTFRSDAKGEDNPARLISNSQATQLALVHFLLEGRFPWWYSIESNSILVDEIFETGWMDSTSENDKTILKNALLNSEAARIRITNHFTAEWIAELLQIIGLSGNEALLQWQLIVRLTTSFNNLKVLMHQHFWLQWIIAASEGRDFVDINSIIIKTASGNRELTAQLAQALEKICNEKSFSQQFSAAFISYIEKEVEKIDKVISSTTTDIPESKKPAHSSLEINADKQTIEKLLDEISSDKKIKTKTKEEEDGLMIAAAGMVILHPFLEELFSSNGLLTKNTWSSGATWSRAVRYLAYLSYGNENAPEYDLVFHKTLVGMDVETAIAADLPLSPEEIASCNELLQAVITHWKALRNTSADGLREAFLQREGKLSLADKGYIVHVAQKPQDILLSHLPWGCGMIKLPWLDNIIHVTWI
jgi:hypothetical protein